MAGVTNMLLSSQNQKLLLPYKILYLRIIATETIYKDIYHNFKTVKIINI